MQVRLGLVTALSLPLLFVCPARAQSTDADVSAADAAYNARQYAAAIPLYQKVVASSLPDDVRAHAQLRLGYSFFGTRDTKQARVEWLRVADGFPIQSATAAEALVRAGNIAISENDYDGAFDAYKRVNDDIASDPDAAPFAAEAVCRLGKVYLHRAEAAKAAGPADEIASIGWERAAADFELSRQAFERVTKEFTGVGGWAAESSFQLVALKYEWAFNDRVTTFDDVIAAADKFLNDGYPDDALRCPKVHLIKAEAMVQQCKFEKAIPELLIIRDKYPTTAEEALGTSRYFLARCYEETGSLAKAEKEYLTLLEGKEKSFDAKSDHAAAEWGLAKIRKKQGRLPEATAMYVRLKGDHPDSQWSRFADEDLAEMTKAAPR